MSSSFNPEEAKQFLKARERRKREEEESARKQTLEKAVAFLKREFQENRTVEVWLVGSILKSSGFSSRSDVDIVLKNYKGDRFELWSRAEREIGREVEILLFEQCAFQDFILDKGYKVV